MLLGHMDKRHYRVLYLLAKNGLVRKSVVSQATSRWPAAIRNQVIEDLADLELIAKQSAPSKAAGAPGDYLWLTVAGVEKVAELADKDPTDIWFRLPTDWREKHAH